MDEDLKVICVDNSDNDLVIGEEYIVHITINNRYFKLKNDNIWYNVDIFKTNIELRKEKIRKLYLKNLPWYKKLLNEKNI